MLNSRSYIAGSDDTDFDKRLDALKKGKGAQGYTKRRQEKSAQPGPGSKPSAKKGTTTASPGTSYCMLDCVMQAILAHRSFYRSTGPCEQNNSFLPALLMCVVSWYASMCDLICLCTNNTQITSCILPCPCACFAKYVPRASQVPSMTSQGNNCTLRVAPTRVT